MRREGMIVSMIARLRKSHAASPSHLPNAKHRFRCAKKNSTGYSIRQTRYVQAVVTAIYEINICVAWRAEQHRVARCAANEGVRRGITFQVRFDLDDARREELFPCFPHQHFAQQFAAHTPRIAVIKLPRQR